MKIDIEFAELHSNLFIDGMNFGLKLYSDSKKSKAPIKLYLDSSIAPNQTYLVVLYKEKTSLIQTWASATIAQIDKPQVKPVLPPVYSTPPTVIVRAQATGPERTIRTTAQVETPHDKVQGRPGRKAKYQGEVVEE